MTAPRPAVALPTRRMAAYITALGGPERITVGELPVPRVGPTDVLVQVVALATNPVDTLVRSGGYATATPFPFVVGRDLVGTVVDAGEGASGLGPGDRVWCNSMGHAGRQGAFATYVVAPVERVYPLSQGVDPVAAVAALHPGATAYLGLFRHGGLGADATVVIGGGAGNVGSCAVELARRAGARVVATAREEDFGRVQALGADLVLDYRDPELTRRLGTAVPEGADVYWDTSGHHDLAQAAAVLARGGRVVLSAAGPAPPALPVRELYTRDAALTGFAISNASVADLAAAARVVNRELAAGRLRTRIAATLALGDSACAHRLVEAPERPGRVVVRP